MPKVLFLPSGVEIEVASGTKLLAAGTRAKVPIRFGCGSCRCGTCAVAIVVRGEVLPMVEDETALLAKMGLATDGSVRLACRTRVVDGEVDVDLAFQDTYSPDDLIEES